MSKKIVGQDDLLKEVNKVIEIFLKSECKIRPHFILTGESGSGKSMTIRHLAKKSNCGYMEVKAAQLTKEGTSGNSLSKALSELTAMGAKKPTIVFVDEFDKLFISGNVNTDLAHETTNGVQNEFLDILEGSTTQVFGDYGKYTSVSTNNLLFIFAGAFNGVEDLTLDDLRSFGLKTEFLGRVGLMYHTTPLTLDNMYNILESSELLNHYLLLFPDVDKEKVVLLLKAYIRDNHDLNTIGARMINTMINQYFIKGKLPKEEVKKITFQHTMKLEEDDDDKDGF